jgi:holo-[acyl-carrier protein] synthase
VLGIDIVELKRIENVLKKHGDKFVNRILSESEKKIYFSRKNKIEFLAGRFAAKEAFIKANESLPFNEIEILNDKNGKPYIKGFESYKVSISHEKKYAVAAVVKL